MFHTDLGQDLGYEKNVVYVSLDNKKTWVTLLSLALKVNAVFRKLKLYSRLFTSCSMLLEGGKPSNIPNREIGCFTVTRCIAIFRSPQ